MGCAAVELVGHLRPRLCFNRISHVHFLHPQGEQQIVAKCLFYIEICPCLVGWGTDSGQAHT